MPLTSAQIVTQATQMAQVPGYTTQAGQLLNVILQELCQNYDFTSALGTFQFNLPTNVDALGRATMKFPADYLRAKPDECFYYIQGVPYKLIPQDLSEMDSMVVTAGLSNFPITFAVDDSQVPPLAYFWMPPSGAFTAIVRYQRLMPDIVSPQASSVIPWFPNQLYLITKLTGELCKLADDDRYTTLLAEDQVGGSGHMLRHYLQMTGDTENRAKQVKLDRRRFGTSFDRLRNTKQVGW